MRSDDVAETVADMRLDVVSAMVTRRIPEKAFAEQWQTAELAEDVQRVFGLDLPVADWGREEGIDEMGIRERIERATESQLAAKAANLGPELMRFIEKSILLQTLDAVWKEHLLALDHLRQGIGLRAYGQRDPLNEYKSEAFAMFHAMLDDLKERVAGTLARVELSVQPEPVPQPMYENHPEAVLMGGELAMAGGPGEALPPLPPMDPDVLAQIPRNAPCPCGSGRKFKHCHGRVG